MFWDWLTGDDDGHRDSRSSPNPGEVDSGVQVGYRTVPFRGTFFYHTWIIIVDKTGKTTTLSGGPKGSFPNYGKLVGAIDAPESSAEAVQYVPLPLGQTPGQFQQHLRTNHLRYNGQDPYWPLPDGNTRNSNSLTGSTLRKSGSNIQPILYAPGWELSVTY